MAFWLTCKNYKPDSPQRWLGSLRSPNQRFRAIALRAGGCASRRTILLQSIVATKIATRSLAVSLRFRSVHPASPVQIAMGTAPRRLPATGSCEFAAGGSYAASQTKRACPVPCFIQTTWTEAGHETKKPGCRNAHQASFLPIETFLHEPSPLESNQPPDQVGPPVLIRLYRRRTAHFLPRHRQSETPGLSRITTVTGEFGRYGPSHKGGLGRNGSSQAKE